MSIQLLPLPSPPFPMMLPSLILPGSKRNILADEQAILPDHEHLRHTSPNTAAYSTRVQTNCRSNFQRTGCRHETSFCFFLHLALSRSRFGSPACLRHQPLDVKRLRGVSSVDGRVIDTLIVRQRIPICPVTRVKRVHLRPVVACQVGVAVVLDLGWYKTVYQPDTAFASQW